MVLLRVTTLRSVLALLLLLMMLPLLPATPVGAAAAITVASNADTGPGTLRQAIADIDAGGTITFAPGLGPITLASGLDIPKAMTITGNGPGNTIIQGGPDPRPPVNSQVWLVTVHAASGTVAFTSLTVRNYYGGIFDTTLMTVTNVTFSGFSYDGIDHEGNITAQNTDTVTDSIFSNNYVGIRHKGGSPISGGAAGRSLSVTDTTFSGNGTGIGIYTQSSAASSVTVTNTTFTGNGTGIQNAPGGPQSLSVTNSTFSGNTVVGFDNEPGTGNASITQPTTITSTTITNNGTGVINKPVTLYEPLTITSSILSTNSADCQTAAPGTITDGGHNLEYGYGAPDTCPFASAAVHADPKLSSLQDNGGPTLTLLPMPGSAAIDMGGATCPATDQRGIPRPQGPACDIGAVEVVPTDTTPPTITPTVTGTLGSNGWYTSNVSVTWAVADPQSPVTTKTGCDPTTVSTDTAAAGVTFTCSATSAGGTGTQSVTIKRDATKPTVTYGAHPASYTIDQTVSITCTAADPTPGSGIASTTCQNVNAPASSFALGANTVSATATDVAGNVGTGQTSFTVTVTPSSLVAVTLADIEGSAKFKALSPREQARIRALGDVLVQRLKNMPPNLPPAEKAKIVEEYTEGVNALVKQGWLTAAQGQMLIAAAGAL